MSYFFPFKQFHSHLLVFLADGIFFKMLKLIVCQYAPVIFFTADGCETMAVPQEDGTYRLYGYKWFSSATDSDMTLTLGKKNFILRKSKVSSFLGHTISDFKIFLGFHSKIDQGHL